MRNAYITFILALILAMRTEVPAAAQPASDPKNSSSKGGLPPAERISGKPFARGLMYGTKYRQDIRQFLDKEIYAAFIQKPAPKDELLRYAGACVKVVQEVCPTIHAELQGIAKGAELKLEEVVLITLHEELYHRGALPKVPHCTAVAVGPPLTGDGNTYVGQTWDWMTSVYGLSRVLEWQREEGPSVLAYGFPGMPCGAGLNSAGLALCWTSADLGTKALGARVGIPSYVLLTHFLYQQDLAAVVKEAKRDKHAGWFTFVMADGDGNLLNIEGSPKGVELQQGKGQLCRVGFGTHGMTGTASGQKVKLHPRCQKMCDLLNGSAGKINLARLQDYFQEPMYQISVGKSTIDMMVYNTTTRTAYLSRGPNYDVQWRQFKFTERN